MTAHCSWNQRNTRSQTAPTTQTRHSSIWATGILDELFAGLLLRLTQQLKLQSRQVSPHLLELRVGTHRENEIDGLILNHFLNTHFRTQDGLFDSNDFFKYFPEAGS